MTTISISQTATTATTATNFNQLIPALMHIEQDVREWRTYEGDHWSHTVISPEGDVIVDCGTVYCRTGGLSPEGLLEVSNPAAMQRRAALREGATLLAESKTVQSGSEGWVAWRYCWVDPSRLPDRIWALWCDRSEHTYEGWYITSDSLWYRLEETALLDAGFFIPNKNPKDGERGVFIRKSSLSQTDSDCPPCRVVSKPI